MIYFTTIRHLPDLKEDFRSHTEEAIDNAESKHHRHTVYIPERTDSYHIAGMNTAGAYKLRNQGRDATDS